MEHPTLHEYYLRALGLERRDRMADAERRRLARRVPRLRFPSRTR